MDYTFSQSCWGACYEEAVCCLYSPLNVSLASGDLHYRDFHHYINQWGHFLIAFPQALDIVLQSLEDQHEDVQAAILERRNFITQEIQWHASFIQECDLDPIAETTQHSVTAKYVEFLLVTASGNLDIVHHEIPTPAEKLKVAAHVLSAITPCVRVSATLAKLVKPVIRRNKRPHRFNMWIDRYSSEEFEAATQQTEELLNRLSNSLTDEERKVLGEVYYQAMKLEVEFFYSCLSVPTKLIPVSLLHNREEERLLLFSVFDFACTTGDSLKGLEQITLSSAKEKSIVGLPPRPGNTHLQMSRADLKKSWDAIAVFDKKKMDEWLLKIAAIIAVGFDYDGLCKVVEQLSVIRENRISRITETGVQKDLSLAQMQFAGTKVNLDYGCVNFFDKVFRNKALNAPVHVISCWCEDLMVPALPGLHASVVIPGPSSVIPPCKGTHEKLDDLPGKVVDTVLMKMLSLLPFYMCKMCKCFIAATEHMHHLQGDELLCSTYPRNQYYFCSEPEVEWLLYEEVPHRIIYDHNMVYFDAKLFCIECERRGNGKNLLGQRLGLMVWDNEVKRIERDANSEIFILVSKVEPAVQ